MDKWYFVAAPDYLWIDIILSRISGLSLVWLEHCLIPLVRHPAVAVGAHKYMDISILYSNNVYRLL